MKNDFVSLLGQTLPQKETNSLIECINAGDSPVSIRVNRKKIHQELKIKDGGEDYLFFTTNFKDELICIHSKKV